jgi:hypothetical protein
MEDNILNWTPNAVASFVQTVAAEARAPCERKPLFRPLPPAPDFPINALGPLHDVALAVQWRTQAPFAIAAQSVLAAATLAVQAHRDVVLPGGGRKPLTAIFISVADSGERKSSVDRIALAAVYSVEEEWRNSSGVEMQTYINCKEAWETVREKAKRANKSDITALQAALLALGPMPKPPPHPMLLVADPTPEALTQHLKDGRPIAGVFTAEGGLLIGGAAFNDESRMRTAALLNTLWDGEAIRRLRVGTGPAYLPGKRCSAHIMLQHVVAQRLLGDAMLDGIGLTARMLIVAPDSTAGTRFYRDVPDWVPGVLSAYGQRLKVSLLKSPVMRGDMPDALDPPPLLLDAAAALMWVAFHDQCEAAIAVNGPLSTIRPFAAKMAEHAGRLAAVLTVYNDPDAMTVSEAAMRCGIDLANYYACEMLRLHGGASVTPELRSAQSLLTWWQSQSNPTLHLSAIYQRGPASLRDAKTARKIVGVLHDHGWVERLEPGAIVDGSPRKEAWRLTYE